MITVYCNTERCDFNEDGFCVNDKIEIDGMFCVSNLLLPEDTDNKEEASECLEENKN